MRPTVAATGLAGRRCCPCRRRCPPCALAARRPFCFALPAGNPPPTRFPLCVHVLILAATALLSLPAATTNWAAATAGLPGAPWQSGTAPCGPPAWAGVTCSTDQQVTAVDLSGLGLVGTLPPALLQGLPGLQTLNLSGNAFNGSLPAQWASSALQTADLSGNSLTGALPPQWLAGAFAQPLVLGLRPGNPRLCGAWAIRALGSALRCAVSAADQPWPGGPPPHPFPLHLPCRPGASSVAAGVLAWGARCYWPQQHTHRECSCAARSSILLLHLLPLVLLPSQAQATHHAAGALLRPLHCCS